MVTIGEQVTDIGVGNFEDIDGIVIVGVPGSYAETYANDNGLTFQDVNAVIYGDVDGSGDVNATDALWALQAYVGSRQLGELAKKAADVNLDGEINTSDALAILQYAVKLRDKLPTV